MSAHERMLRLVEREMRDEATADEVRWLKAPENVQRWYDTLVAKKMELETQLVTRKADLAAFKTQCIERGAEAKAEFFRAQNSYEAWRATAVGFKGHLERKLAEVKRIRHLHAQAGAIDQHGPNHAVWTLLKWASLLIERDARAGAEWHAAARDCGLKLHKDTTVDDLAERYWSDHAERHRG